MDHITTRSRISRRVRRSATSLQWRAIGGGRAENHEGVVQELQEGRTAGRELLEGDCEQLANYWPMDSCAGLLEVNNIVVTICGTKWVLDLLGDHFIRYVT